MRWTRTSRARGKTLLNEPLEFFKALRTSLQNDSGTKPESLARLAQALFDLATLTNLIGNKQDALIAYREALAIRQKLADTHPTDSKFQSDLTTSYNNIGVVLHETGKPKEAIVWQNKALAANPRNPIYRRFLANHLTNLKMAAQGLGNADVVAEANRGLAELRDSDPAMIALDARLSAIIKGDYQPCDNPERLTLAKRAYEKSLHTTAALLIGEALAVDPKLADDRKVQIRYNAACYAALAASSSGKDKLPLDDIAKATLRKQALDYLNAELVIWDALIESGAPEAKARIVQTLQHWQQDSDLAGIRNEAELAKLPAEDQQAFKQLWADVAVLLKKPSTATELDKP